MVADDDLRGRSWKWVKVYTMLREQQSVISDGKDNNVGKGLQEERAKECRWFLARRICTEVVN